MHLRIVLELVLHRYKFSTKIVVLSARQSTQEAPVEACLSLGVPSEAVGLRRALFCTMSHKRSHGDSSPVSSASLGTSEHKLSECTGYSSVFARSHIYQYIIQIRVSVCPSRK